MKPDIHPRYERAIVTCACGNRFETRSTKGSFNVDVCAVCHPFFTGRQKIVDTAGRVERFRKKYERGQQAAATKDAAATGKSASKSRKKTAAS
ncbi:MAG: 50S ribosomal protein L31 [Myxococcota bacterium]|nr:50S ribosomal protein L31 [Myxococcota bacterium]MDW8363492.1 50S ribosomal protein L31 [Myxococcales bacterium]